MVSIIVPIYNVYEYIDDCVNSLVNQTYTDIEILLINDGSKDNSWDKCIEWSERDRRIRIFTKKNEGLGFTRNFGIDKSRGDYIMYVDSDDWVDITIVEKLMASLTQTGSDISVCDRYNYVSSTKCYDVIRNEIPFDTKFIDVDKCPDIIKNVRCVAWSKIYKKSLLIENNIRQPSCEWEDVITPVTLACAKRISYVNQPLYFYRIDRKSSISNSLDFLDNFKYIKVLLSEFKARGFYDRFESQICEIIAFRVKCNVCKALSNQARIKSSINERIISYGNNIKKYLAENGIENNNVIDDIVVKNNPSVCVIGSYNLMSVAKMMTGSNFTPASGRFYSFSSLISIMGSVNLEFLDISFEGESLFRKGHIINDICKGFAYSSRACIDNCSAIFVDLLEERFDIGCIGDTYITLSDAFMASTLEKQLDYNVISAASGECEKLWEEACLKFISLLESRYSDKTIILVKTKLAEYYGNSDCKKRYEQCVLNVNDMLERRYRFFEKHLSRAIVVEPESSPMYFTDEKFRHGCFPWHLNTDMYCEISRMITDKILG